MDKKQRIRNYFKPEEVIDLASELVRIESHKDAPNREAEVGDYIIRYCEQNGLEVQIDPLDGKRKNIYIYLRGKAEGKTILLNGHIDTVPPYNMTISPFSGEVIDGRLWGRGSNDMKGAVACMIVTLLALKRSGGIASGNAIVAAVVGEEENSDGTEKLVISGIKADAAIVGEPSNYEYAIGHRGLEWLEFVFKGKAAHGGVPNEGINAISMAAKFISSVESELIPKLKSRINPYMGESVMNFGRIEGGTQPSTVADLCRLQVDRRYIDGETVEGVIKEYQDIIDKLKREDSSFNCEIVRMPSNLMNQFNHIYHFTSPDERIVRVVDSVLESHLGKEAVVTRKRGWTDAATLSYYGKIPTVITGPGDISQSHTVNESIPVEDLIKYVEIYSEIVMDFLKA